MSSISHSSRAQYDVTVKTLEDILNQLNNEEIEIPSHQRDFCWKMSNQMGLVITVLEGLPMPSIIFRQPNRGEQGKLSLEDGSQRLRTLNRYKNNEFSVKGKKFCELTVREQERFNLYKMPTLIYKGLTNEQAIDLFDKFQNGVPLSIGERLKSLLTLSPIIALAKDLLLTPGKGFHDRAIDIWGKHDGIGKRGNDLTMAVSLVGGLAFSDNTKSYYSKKYEEMSEIIKKSLTKEVENRVAVYLSIILDIYEEVQKQKPLAKKSEINFQWNHGNITNYIAYSFTSKLTNIETLKDGWIKYLVEMRRERDNCSGLPIQKFHKALQAKLHKDVSEARSWSLNRWHMGYLRVFNPDEAERIANSGLSDYESTDNDDE